MAMPSALQAIKSPAFGRFSINYHRIIVIDRFGAQTDPKFTPGPVIGGQVITNTQDKQRKEKIL